MESGFCVWFPVLVFLSGAALGLVLYYLNKKNTPDNNNESLSNNTLDDFLKKKAIESRLLAEENTVLESKLNKIHDQLNIILGKDLYQTEKTTAPPEIKAQKTKADLLKENKKLKKKLKNIKQQNSDSAEVGNDKHLNDYKAFLNNLEKAVKKAKKKTQKELPDLSKKKNKASLPVENEQEDDFTPGNEDKFQFFKEKFSKMAASQEFNPEKIFAQKEEQSPKSSLTDLYGITNEIQGLLAEHDIFTFDDLSKTSISDLKHILNAGGEKYNAVNPLNWPLQARLAVKGHWDVIKEYKRKMDENQ